jgi:alanine racemase
VKKALPLSHIELSKENLIHNIKQFREFAKKGTEFAVAIKGNAYGHGQNEVAKIAEPYVDYFQVNSFEELVLLRKVSKKKTFVFGYIEKTDLKEAVRLGCMLSIFSIEQLKEVNKVAGQLKVRQEIHVPVDAHLGREGFLLEELPKLLVEIKKSKNIKLGGLYAHFANIEDTRDFSHAQKQINQYKSALKLADKFCAEHLPDCRDGIQTHISATSGLLVYEKGDGIHPLVRLGIGVYGMWPSKYLKLIYKNFKINLKPIITWKTKIAKVKILPKGSPVGYGLTYVTKKKMKIAIIPQGYADGLDRGFSNNGVVLIGGKRCRILGRVHMNMSAVDVDHIPNVKNEDEVVILGRQGKEEITAEEMAGRVDTINYEITTRISPILPRIIR